MNLLVVHASHDGSITIIKNDKLFVHAQIERFLKTRGFNYACDELLLKIKKLNINFDRVVITALSHHHTIYNWGECLKQYKIIDKNFPVEVIYNSNHHLFHMLCAKVFAPNKHILVMDGSGDFLKINDDIQTYEACEIESLYTDDRLVFKNWVSDAPFNKFENPNWHIVNRSGYGHCYENVTKSLFDVGMEALLLTGKTMALSSYGTYNQEMAYAIKEQIKRRTFCRIVIPFLNDKKENKQAQDFIKTFQVILEEHVKTMMPLDNVTFTGGIAQNVLNNSQFLNYPNFNVDPLCNDQGISLGCANAIMQDQLHLDTVYLGFEPEYDLSVFNNYKIIDVTFEEVAKIIHEEPVGLFQGRSEQGQRGLGNRSLLMNPVHPYAVEKVNEVKKREWYRPFAPSILEEFASDFYEINRPSPYMLFVFKSKKHIPSVTAIDGTSRIQTVNEKQNYNYYNLIKTYYKLYGIPLLLNTSLNLSGFPLAETLKDCEYMLDNSKLKYLYLPDIGKLIKKDV